MSYMIEIRYTISLKSCMKTELIGFCIHATLGVLLDILCSIEHKIISLKFVVVSLLIQHNRRN